jgi:hypothetical protein
MINIGKQMEIVGSENYDSNHFKMDTYRRGTSYTLLFVEKHFVTGKVLNKFVS